VELRPNSFSYFAVRIFAGALKWLLGVVFMFGSLYLIYNILHSGEQAIPPPGWVCSNILYPYSYHSADCVPMTGWHFELDNEGRRIAAHDVPRTQQLRQLDVDTAEGWDDLDNTERQEILDHKATIYKFFEFDKQ
jgi:hypothetical protein